MDCNNNSTFAIFYAITACTSKEFVVTTKHNQRLLKDTDLLLPLPEKNTPTRGIIKLLVYFPRTNTVLCSIWYQ